ncbi:MAG: urease accessory protein UreD [Pseudomonadota bacterium]
MYRESSTKCPQQQGWQADLTLEYEEKCVGNDTKTIVSKRRHRGPLTVQRAFYPEPDGTCHSYLLHPPAGLVGGDSLNIDLVLHPGAKAVLTTPGATRFYKSTGHQATLTQKFSIADKAYIEWLPQETLIYDRARTKVTSEFHLHGSAQFFGWEILGFGRPASGEDFTNGEIDFYLQVFRDKRLCLRERLASTGLPSGLHGHRGTMTLIASGSTPAALETARELCSESKLIAAPTLIEDLLIVRGLASDCEPLNKLCRQLWRSIRPQLSQRDAYAPQIWRT